MTALTDLRVFGMPIRWESGWWLYPQLLGLEFGVVVKMSFADNKRKIFSNVIMIGGDHEAVKICIPGRATTLYFIDGRYDSPSECPVKIEVEKSSYDSPCIIEHKRKHDEKN